MSRKHARGVRHIPRLPLIAACALAVACDNPSAPDEIGYAGQWSGTTAQGRPIDFTIRRRKR